ncbi:hypothetical protein B0H10DRAFT_2053028 [Mycena sp. CBHHK59/15]|nr:hypothetical protein B0H10DRAFT_2053028 [Mycena sp. CBHHK59/15]
MEVQGVPKTDYLRLLTSNLCLCIREMAEGPSTTGILSGVFSFVSREFESFITNATGGSTPEDQPNSRVNSTENARSASSRTTLEDVRNPGGPVRTQRRTPDSSRDRQQRRRERKPPNIFPPSKHAPAPKSKRRVAVVVEEEELASEHSLSRSPSPQPLPRALRRRPSFTMPGSLFPRSASMDPESPPEYADPRQVRFAPDIISPATRRRPEIEGPLETSPSPTRAPTTPLRPRTVPSVKAAVERFHVGADNADPSILLPSSKGKRKAEAPTEEADELPRIPAKDKGKARACDLGDDADTSGEVRVRGKERELFAAREVQKRNEKRRWERDKEKDREDDTERDIEREKDKERIRMLEDEILRLKDELSNRPFRSGSAPPPPPPPPPPLFDGGRLPTSEQTTLFVAARASLKRTALPVEAPINPILPVGGARRQGQPTVGVPPDKMAAFLAEMKHVRLRKTTSSNPVAASSSNWRGGSAGSTDSSAVGVGGRNISTGHAAILKKVGESFSRSHTSTTPSIAVGETSWARNRSTSWSRERSVVLNPVNIGEKRKRAINPQEDSELADDQEHASKRRSSSSSSSLQHPAISTSFSRSNPLARPTMTRDGTITTPSLCDDDGDSDERDRLPSTPPAVAAPPSHPPGHISAPVRKLFVPPPRKEREIIDVDMDVYAGTVAVTPPRLPRASTGDRRTLPPSSADVFAKRPPSSPMPAQSPRRPRPPARTARMPPPPTAPPEAEEEDELSLSFDTQETSDPNLVDAPLPSKGKAKASSDLKSRARGQAPLAQPRSQSPLPPLQLPSMRREKERSSVVPSVTSTSSRGTTTGRTKNRRRQTLDEELRSAAAAARSPSQSRSIQRDRELERELESGTLVGVGTRPKNRGFLARGGAGGEPVLMGVGYVAGVEDEEEGDEGDVGNASDDSDDTDYEPPKAAGRRKRKGIR